MGLPPGRHHLGTMEVNIEKNRATLVGTNTLAGRLADFCWLSFLFFVFTVLEIRDVGTGRTQGYGVPQIFSKVPLFSLEVHYFLPFENIKVSVSFLESVLHRDLHF